MPVMERTHVVAAIIVDDLDAPTRVLGARRVRPERLAGRWEFPGGKVEPGEGEEAALVRELQEELDVPVSVGARLWEGTHAYPDLEVELVLYATRLLDGVPWAVTAQQLAWCTFGEMQTRAFCEADVPLIAGLIDGTVPTA